MSRFSRVTLVRLAAAAGLACAALAPSALVSAGEGWGAAPTPTPTPAERSLGEVGSPIRLDATATPSPTIRRLVIDDATVRTVAGESEVTTARPPSPHTLTQVESRSQTRELRRTEYGDQVALILSLRSRKKALADGLPDLWNRFYSEDDPARREAVARRDLDAGIQEHWRVEALLATAESALAEMKARAYAEGADPGWFRDLDLRFREHGE